jgi:hypothetical protein
VSRLPLCAAAAQMWAVEELVRQRRQGQSALHGKQVSRGAPALHAQPILRGESPALPDHSRRPGRAED